MITSIHQHAECNKTAWVICLFSYIFNSWCLNQWLYCVINKHYCTSPAHLIVFMNYAAV